MALLVAANVAAWLLIHMGFAWAGTRLPCRLFKAERGLFRIRGFERQGALYERTFRIRSWKDLLPDGARLFEGGFPKGRLARRDADYLRRFVLETRRGETVHWAVFLASGLFFLWNPANIAVWMILYAALANFPCILAQRYNRARLERLLRSRARHDG
jgi:glycosyl-4,4'-diaponeurosporenoate acyltransferase